MEDLVQQVANVGLTILCVVVAVIIVNWLDRNVFSGHKNFKKDSGNTFQWTYFY